MAEINADAATKAIGDSIGLAAERVEAWMSDIVRARDALSGWSGMDAVEAARNKFAAGLELLGEAKKMIGDDGGAVVDVRAENPNAGANETIDRQ